MLLRISQKIFNPSIKLTIYSIKNSLLGKRLWDTLSKAFEKSKDKRSVCISAFRLQLEITGWNNSQQMQVRVCNWMDQFVSLSCELWWQIFFVNQKEAFPALRKRWISRWALQRYIANDVSFSNLVGMPSGPQAC